MSAAGLRHVLRNGRFRYLFAGITLSRVGDSMTFIVISWIALGIGGPRALGLVVFTGGVVSPLTAPLIGFLIDHLGLRLLMLIDNAGRGTIMLGFAALVHYGHVRIEYLVVFTALSAAISPATEVGQNVAVPMLLASAELDAANTLLASSWDVAAWLGPAFAGFAISLIGSSPVLLIDAGTFFAMASIALTMPGKAVPSEEEPAEDGGTLARMLAGFRVLWRLRPVAILSIVAVADLFLGGMMEVFLPSFNKLTLQQGPGQYGLLVSIAGLACLCGTLLLTPLVMRRGYGEALVVVLVARGLAVLPLAFLGSWALTAIFVAAAAVPDGSFFPISRTISQRLIPASVLGRVQGARGALGVIGWPLGSAVGGLLIAAVGGHGTAAIMAFGYLPLAAAIMLTPALMSYARPAAEEQPG